MRFRRAEDHRDAPRFKIPPMYTLLRVKPHDEPDYRWTGYVHDLSTKGMRFELDDPLAPGTRVQVRAMLPGCDQPTFTAAGHVVRIHDDDGLPGPVRMAMTFDTFAGDSDQVVLAEYLAKSTLRAA